ncbi:hypothetical protein [Streptomyces sp. NPDC048157]|uniref:hypothetical protein n=1 Tax=Streptomyces sp. NPDC048157 TaxID=3365503 RepID=UPI0037223E8C
MTTATEAREYARPYQGPSPGSPIAHFVRSGEITPSLLDALAREQDGAHIESDCVGWERLDRVIRYVRGQQLPAGT